jgi:hypothetical protein
MPDQLKKDKSATPPEQAMFTRLSMKPSTYEKDDTDDFFVKFFDDVKKFEDKARQFIAVQGNPFSFWHNIERMPKLGSKLEKEWKSVLKDLEKAHKSNKVDEHVRKPAYAQYKGYVVEQLNNNKESAKHALKLRAKLKSAQHAAIDGMVKELLAMKAKI